MLAQLYLKLEFLKVRII